MADVATGRTLMPEQVERRNAVWNALGEASWGFGGGLAAVLTVMPLLVKKMGGGNVEIGLISAFASAGVLLPQVLGTLVVQSGSGRKRFLLTFHWFTMIPAWAGLGAAVLFVAPQHPFAARVMVHVSFATFMLSMGFAMPVWVDWVAGLFRQEVRGRAYAWANGAAAGSGALASVLAGVIVAAVAFPNNYGLLFFIGTAFFMISMLVFVLVREPVAETKPCRMPTAEMIGRFRQSLSDRNFRHYLISRLLLTMGIGPIAFFSVYYESAQGGGLTAKTIIVLGAGVTVSQMLVGMLLGRMGDRFGHKRGAMIGAASQLAGLAVALLLPGAVGCGLAFALVGVGYASGWVSHQNLIFETCPHDSRIAHITVSSLVVAPFVAIVPILAANAIKDYGMLPTLAASLVPTALGVAWLALMVKEPRTAESTR